jgi:hypothetical protein
MLDFSSINGDVCDLQQKSRDWHLLTGHQNPGVQLTDFHTHRQMYDWQLWHIGTVNNIEEKSKISIEIHKS